MKELYSLSSFALRDLFEIWDYTQKDDPDAADRVEAELLAKCESLARMPGQGHRRADYTTHTSSPTGLEQTPYRFWPLFTVRAK